MNAQKMIELTNDVVQAYYRNDLRLFYEYLDEKILWYGPAKGQFLSGRQALVDAWGQEAHRLTFTLGNIRLDHSTSHPSYCEVLMSFPVTTHYPNGEQITMYQIIHITWCERKVEGMEAKQPRMLVIHISDLYQKHEADEIYPVHLNQTYQGYVPVAEAGRRIHFQGLDRTDHYLLSDTIIWAESSGNGKHAVLHMTDAATVDVMPTTQSIEKTEPTLFLRCHSSYLVNPRHVTQIRRFRVSLTDGRELPIPEKKYTAFKKAMNEYWERTAK